MTQVLTPEEMAALFEGLRETETAPDAEDGDAPAVTDPEGGVFQDQEVFKIFPTGSAM